MGKLKTTQVLEIKARVCIFIKYWMQERGYDIAGDDSLTRTYKYFVEQSVEKELGETMAKMLNLRLADETKLLQEKTKVPALLVPSGVEEVKKKRFNFEDLDPVTVAEQLTAYAWRIYKDIRFEEFFNGAWTDKDKAPNVVASINFFNHVAGCSAHLILQQTKLRKRVKMMSKFIKIAECLRQLNNYHLLMAIVSSFSSAAVARLKWTRAKLAKRPKQILEDLETLMSPKGSFRNYRLALDNSALPAMPYLGVCIQDLTFIHEGNPDKVESRINFQKRELVYEVIIKIRGYQEVAYTLELNPELAQTLIDLPTLDDEQLYNLSLSREPRGASRTDIV